MASRTRTRSSAATVIAVAAAAAVVLTRYPGLLARLGRGTTVRTVRPGAR